MLRVVRTVVAEQSEDQARGLPRREHQGPPMGVLGVFGILFGSYALSVMALARALAWVLDGIWWIALSTP